MNMRLTMLVLALGCLAHQTSGAASANDPPADDLDALSLADKAPASDPAAAQALQWRLFVEGAVGAGKLRGSDSDFSILRGSIDFRIDAKLAPGLRGVFSDRLDLVDSDGVPPGDNLNTLREAYLSWSRRDDQIFDLGRVNIRNGAAMGFNPTDWFKANALRSIVNPDPAVLRENRQGTVVLQMQQLWNKASLSAAISPKLARSPDSATFALNVGATNPANRYLVAGSYKLSDTFNPQLLIYGGEDIPPQVGLNLSTVMGDSTVLYGELAVGKGTPLIAQALAIPEPNSQQQRATLGLTYTTSVNLTLSAELQYSSAGADEGQWQALDPAAQQQLLYTAQALQDLPSRSQVFVQALWKDLFVRRFDLSGFLRQDIETNSQAFWIEGRYSWEQVQLALQWQAFTGPNASLYYAAPQQQTLQLVLRVYL
jgi:hypothetical protein